MCGYLTESRDLSSFSSARGNCSHLTLGYKNDGTSSFALYINGDLIATDRTQVAQGNFPADGRTVLGRAYSDMDAFYTSIDMDELGFYNHPLSSDAVYQLWSTDCMW